VGVLPEEEYTLVDKLADDEQPDLAEVAPRDEFLWGDGSELECEEGRDVRTSNA
jgi:hypothetical protein